MQPGVSNSFKDKGGQATGSMSFDTAASENDESHKDRRQRRRLRRIDHIDESG